MDKKRKINTIIGYSVFAILIVLLFVARFTYGTIINVDGMSMYPTFQDGGFVFATILRDNDTVEAGDVVILKEEGVYLIKRVHATPGESTKPDAMKGIPPLTMGEDEYYVLGDNWENSRDSRYFGTISRSDIQFKFSGLYWTRSQMFVGVFIPLVLFIASLTIALIPAERVKRNKTSVNTANVIKDDSTIVEIGDEEDANDNIFAAESADITEEKISITADAPHSTDPVTESTTDSPTA